MKIRDRWRDPIEPQPTDAQLDYDLQPGDYFIWFTPGQVFYVANTERIPLRIEADGTAHELEFA